MIFGICFIDAWQNMYAATECGSAYGTGMYTNIYKGLGNYIVNDGIVMLNNICIYGLYIDNGF